MNRARPDQPAHQKSPGRPLGPVDLSFRALSGRLQLTVRRYKFNNGSLSACWPSFNFTFFAFWSLRFFEKLEEHARISSIKISSLQGWTTDFIPKLVDDAQTAGLVDEVRPFTPWICSSSESGLVMA